MCTYTSVFRVVSVSLLYSSTFAWSLEASRSLQHVLVCLHEIGSSAQTPFFFPRRIASICTRYASFWSGPMWTRCSAIYRSANRSAGDRSFLCYTRDTVVRFVLATFSCFLFTSFFSTFQRETTNPMRGQIK